MADFCNQCARALGLPEGDFKYVRRDEAGTPILLEPDQGWVELCEGCGPTLTDDDGNCTAHDCDRKHGMPPK